MYTTNLYIYYKRTVGLTLEMNGWDNESKIYFSKTNATFHILDNFEDFKKNGGVDTPYEI